MSKSLVYVVGGIVILGVIVVYVSSQSTTTKSAMGLGNSNTGNVWGFLGHILSAAEKVLPSFFENKDPAEGKNFSDYASTAIYGLDS